MEKTTTLEIPEDEVPKLEAALSEVIARLREIDEEHEARQSRIAALSAETDQMLDLIRRSLANVEKYLSASDPAFHLQ
jgi:hypothetical protein